MKKQEFYMKVELENGTLNISGRNDGFTAFELLGFLEWKKEDIFKQMKGEIKPDIVKREVVECDTEAEESKEENNENV